MAANLNVSHAYSSIVIGWSGATGFSPANATTYYFGPYLGVAAGTTERELTFVIGFACTIVRADLVLYVAGTLGTTETNNFLLRQNNTTDNTLITGVEWNAVATNFSGTGLTIAVAAGDYFEGKFTTPTWATKPTTTLGALTLTIQAT